jgi:hypothetical protein
MTDEGERRRLLRLRGWGREGGIFGQEATRHKRVQPEKRKAGDPERIEAMRRAAALYLASRECVARDLAYILLPGGEGKGSAGDLMVFTRRDVFLVGFALPKRPPGAALARMAGRVRDLGRPCRIIHAETPAHAVEQLASLIDGEGA